MSEARSYISERGLQYKLKAIRYLKRAYSADGSEK